nr:ribose ABC transporter permease [Cytophagales bacterium]
MKSKTDSEALKHNPEAGSSNKLIGNLLRNPENTIVYVCLFYYLVMAFIAPGFFTVNNSWNILFNLMPLMIVAVGQTFVMLGAGIDLSVTSVVAMASIIGGYLLSDMTALVEPVWLRMVMGLGAMVLAGGLIGFLNGLAVTRLGMPAFMVTLTTMILFSGTAIWLTRSQNLYLLPENFVNLTYSSLLFVPYPLLIGLIVISAAWFLLNKTLFGEWLLASGMNSKTAYLSGVPVSKTLVKAYVLSGCCAAVASILYTARLETGSPVMGQHILLDVIGAVVIGGTSLFGGVGKIHWTVVGAVFMTLLDNSLNLLGLSYFLIMIVKGLVILLAALLNLMQVRKLT